MLLRLYRYVLLSILATMLLSARAQQNDIPLQRDFYIDVERNAAKREARIHSGLKPVIESRADLTHVMGHRVDSAKYYYWITQKIFKEHLLEITGEDFKLTADVLFQFEFGHELADRTAYPDTNNYFSNVRGAWLTGRIGERLSFQTMVHEHQAILPQYLFLEAADRGVLSGQGRVKIERKRVLDYGWSQGNVSYSPVDWLNVQFGNGKHFVGHGYRSVLLSDHALNAPFLKFSARTTNGRLQYTTWVNKLQSGVYGSDRLPTGESSESLFHWMHGRFNHASLNLGRVQLGLFEATIFQNIDSNGVRPFDMLELNPVIGVNTALRGFSGREGGLVGMDLRVKLTDKGYVYGQFATDDASGERYAYQVGVRWFDVVRKDLHVQLEHNAATAFTYMHNPAKQAYKHAALPLAHPFGANFSETVAIVDATVERFIGQVKVVAGTYHRDPSDTLNYGGDLRKPDIAVNGPDGPVVQALIHVDANVGYLLNPNTNMRIYLGLQRRGLTNATDNEQSSFLYFGIRTSLFNRYYDL